MYVNLTGAGLPESLSGVQLPTSIPRQTGYMEPDGTIPYSAFGSEYGANPSIVPVQNQMVATPPQPTLWQSIAAGIQSGVLRMSGNIAPPQFGSPSAGPQNIFTTNPQGSAGVGSTYGRKSIMPVARSGGRSVMYPRMAA